MAVNDKLSIIQSALAGLGNNVPNAADDGSDEWTVASAAYEAALDGTIQAHNWDFASTVATLERSGDSTDPDYDDAYTKPSDMLALTWVRVDDVMISDWKIVGNQIVLNSGDGVVTCLYVRTPDPASWPPMFVDVMRLRVQAGVLEGFHENFSAAASKNREANQRLAEARARVDQDRPKRNLFRSRLAAARRGVRLDRGQW